MNQLINPTIAQIAMMAGLLALVGVVSWRMGLGLEKALAIGLARCALQLSLLGMVLKSIFAADHWSWVLLALAVMGTVASLTVVRRQKVQVPGLLPVVAGTLVIAVGIVIVYLTQAVLRIDPWFDPHYVIPFTGMMLGNAMNTLALAFDRLAGELKNRQDEIETALALGADPERAARNALRAAVRAAAMPTMMELATVGLVQIPGTMSGQILGGVDPAIAVKYQMLVMFAWAASSTFAVLLGTRWGLRHYFTADLSLNQTLTARE